TRTVDELDRRLERIERRLAERALEGPAARQAAVGEAAAAEAAGDRADAAPVPAAAGDAAPPTEHWALPEELTYVGRTLLVLGGAYLIRAATESGALPAALGVALGLLYGAAWIGLAWRAAGAGRRHSAVAHGIAAAAVALPLVWETTVRFGLLPPALGAALLLAVLAGLYGVAWHRDLPALAWVAGVGGFVAATTTMLGSSALPPYVAVLVLLGGLVLASEPGRDLLVLAWATAIGADLGVLILSVAAAAGDSRVDPAAAMAAQLLLPVVYLGLFAVFALRGRRPLDAFAVLQSIAAVVLGLSGMLACVGRAEGLAPAAGGLTLALGLAAYVLAFRVVDRSRRDLFHYLGALGTVFTLCGTGLLLPRPEVLWALLVPLAAAAGWRLGRISLSLHAAAFAVAAAWASGLLVDGLRTLLAPAGTAWGRPDGTALLALVATLLALAVPAPAGPYQGRVRTAARIVLLLVAVVGLEDLAVRAGAWALGLAPAAATDPGVLAALRTTVVALAAVALAAASRLDHLAAARWLVYPVLLTGGLKLLFEDFLAGRPATLVLSFLAFGAALIVAPRLVARERRETRPRQETA
ncbi:MAG TPA: hypothetical protein VF100_08305, partial [Thermoanaerobaculia bacterium]